METPQWFQPQMDFFPGQLNTMNCGFQQQQNWFNTFASFPIQTMTEKNGVKKDVDDPWGKVDAQSAFLGPSLWDNADFTVDYSELDEFLSGGGIALEDVPAIPELNKSLECRSLSRQSSLESSKSMSTVPVAPAAVVPPSILDLVDDSSSSCTFGGSVWNASPVPAAAPAAAPAAKIFSPAELALASQPGKEFDPANSSFSPDELRPQPMLKKSRKKVVPDGNKDDKYWARRQKNNMAAKKSRDARRLKENQIIMRASFLEKENSLMKAELEKVYKEKAALALRLSKYEKL